MITTRREFGFHNCPPDSSLLEWTTNDKLNTILFKVHVYKCMIQIPYFFDLLGGDRLDNSGVLSWLRTTKLLEE